MTLDGVLGDRYEIQRELGSGSSAVVYLARDLRLDRLVALKVLRPELNADPDYVERFQSEARAAASLTHPNVVAIYDFGQSGGYNFIAMEYVSGGNLKSLIERKGRLSPAEALPIAEQVLGALGAAHARGIVHRDIKPQNILLTPEPVAAKVTDFGIAHVGNVGRTERGLTLGTALYMSPEQALGEKVTPASDLYSFGVVLFEMLAGRPPFTGSNPVEVALHQVQDPPPRLSALVPGIPAHLEALVNQALEKMPARRWGSSEEALRALRDYHDQTLQATGAFAPVAAARRPETGTGRMPAPAPVLRRPSEVPETNRWARAILGLFALALLAALVTAGLYLTNNLPRGIVPTATATSAPTGTVAPAAATPAASPTRTPTPTASPTATATASPTPSVTPTASPTPSPPPSPSASPPPTATQVPSTAQPTATATPVPPTPTHTPTPTVTPKPGTSTPTGTRVATATTTAGATPTPGATVTPTP